MLIELMPGVEEKAEPGGRPHQHGKSEQAAGSWDAIDKDGDIWWLWWSDSAAGNPWGVISGTGKYEGMTGGGTTVTDVQLPDGSVIFNRPTPGSAASWVVATPRTFSLQPGQTQMVQVTIDIPVQPDPGDHQVGLTFLVPVKGSGGTVNINRGIGTQLLIAVPGPIVHGVLLPGLSAPWFSDGGPVPLTLTVRNQGTVHEDYYAPNGVLGSASGGRVTFSDFSVLRQTTRTVRGEWDNPPLLCWCSVRAYGDDGNGTTMSASTRVLVFPFRLLIGLVVAMVGLYLARSEIRNRRSAARAAATAALETKLEEARRQGFEEAARAGVPPPAASPRKGSGSGVARPRAPVDGDAGNAPAARRRPRRRGDKQS